MDEKTIKIIMFLIPIALTVVGGMITLLLAINAFFIKGLIASINEMKLQVATLTTEHSLLSTLSTSHEQDLRGLREKMHTVINDMGAIKLHEMKIEALNEKVHNINLKLAKGAGKNQGAKP